MPCHDECHEDHDHDIPLESGPQDSLFKVVDTEHVRALNAEGGPERGKVVINLEAAMWRRVADIRDWASRDDETTWLESELDDSLILHIPFTASVSLRSITLKAFGDHRPVEMRVFANGAGLDFSDAEGREPTQSFDVVDTREPAEYQVKAAKFASVTSLALFFPHNISEGDDEETTRVYYIGLRGSWRPLPGQLGQIVYEAAPRPTDHKVKGDAMAAAPRQGF